MKGKTLDEIFEVERPADLIIADLKKKIVDIPSWDKVLVKEYEPKHHPVMDKALYPDIIEDGVCKPVTRVAFNTQKLCVKRMAGMCFGIPAEVNFQPENNNAKQEEVAKYIGAILDRVRIDSVNFERAKHYFAACEAFTLWYGVKSPNTLYGFKSDIKLRCRVFSPMNGDELYPLFDEYGDLVAFSIAYSEKSNEGMVQWFDTYTADKHYRWINEGHGWVEDDVEDITTSKIPGVYIWRPEPIWEDSSHLVYDRERKMSLNGNYIDKNNKPVFVIHADDSLPFGEESVTNQEDRLILQLPANAKAEYVTWQQSVESLKFHTDTLKSAVFEQLQIPNWSYEDMKAVRTSGEGLKQLMIDAHLKVMEESGKLKEMLDREVNVIKAFLKQMLDASYAEAIDSLQFEVVITPYIVSDEKERISNLAIANGNKPMISQKESIRILGYSKDPEQTMRDIAEETVVDTMSL